MLISSKRVRVSLLLTLAIVPQAVFADGYFDKGKELFEKKKYQEALPYLHQAVTNAPWDSTAAYYEALDYQYLKRWKEAARAYEGVMEHFPGTQAYNNAMAAVRVLDPRYLREHPADHPAPVVNAAPASGGGAGEDMSALLSRVVVSSPNEVKIPVTRVTDKTWVDGSINGRNFKFDFGSSDTVISPKDAEALKLGVTSGHVPVSIKVGQISETNFPLTVGETDSPKLGKDFFLQFTYALEPSYLVATRKTGSSANSSWDVPYRQSGKNTIVDVQCNGRHCSFILDPEASETVVPLRRAREFGLDIQEQSMFNKYDPVNNPNGPQRGEPGYGEIKTSQTADAKIVFGPAASQVRIKLDEKATDAKLSPGVLSGWKYKIDPAAKMIRFSR